MFGWFRRAPSASEASSSLAERLGALESAVKYLKRDVDDLDERFASFKGRVTKREALARPTEEAAPADVAAAPGAPRPGRLASVAALRAAGRWPL